MASRYELINLANAAHNHANQAPVPNGWEVELDNKGNEVRYFGDISLVVYKNGSDKVIAIRGSDGFDGGDWANNIRGFGLGELTPDIKELLTFVYDFKKTENAKNNPNISVTGFSQGGGLAELISHTFGLEGLSIDGPGAGAITNDPDYQTYLDDLNITAQGTPEGFVALKEQGSPVGSLGESLSNEETVNYVQGSYDNGNIPDYTDDTNGTLSHQHNLKNITDGFNQQHLADQLSQLEEAGINPLDYDTWQVVNSPQVASADTDGLELSTPDLSIDAYLDYLQGLNPNLSLASFDTGGGSSLNFNDFLNTDPATLTDLGVNIDPINFSSFDLDTIDIHSHNLGFDLNSINLNLFNGSAGGGTGLNLTDLKDRFSDAFHGGTLSREDADFILDHLLEQQGFDSPVRALMRVGKDELLDRLFPESEQANSSVTLTKLTSHFLATGMSDNPIVQVALGETLTANTNFNTISMDVIGEQYDSPPHPNPLPQGEGDVSTKPLMNDPLSRWERVGVRGLHHGGGHDVIQQANTHKISSPPIGGKECSLKVA